MPETKKSNKVKKIIAVSGEAGSFSEEAGLLYAQRLGLETEFNYAIDMEGVLSQVEQGRQTWGFFLWLIHEVFSADRF